MFMFGEQSAWASVRNSVIICMEWKQTNRLDLRLVRVEYRICPQERDYAGQLHPG